MRRASSAFTLSEVILCTGLIAVAILSMATLFISGLRLKAKTTQLTMASELAREMMERTKSLGFSALPTAATTFDGFARTPVNSDGFPPLPYPSRKVGGRDYTLVVHCAPDSTRTELVDVVVEVHWGESSRVKLGTRMTNVAF